MIKLYGYKKCSTCKKAENHLSANNMDYEYIDIVLNPPKEKELKAIIKLSGKDIKSFYNTSGILYREMNMKEKRENMTENEQIKILAANGKLIKRPLVTDGKIVSLGFKGFSDTWK